MSMVFTLKTITGFLKTEAQENTAQDEDQKEEGGSNMFTSRSKNIEEFLRMARLISYLESDARKEDKIFEIKAARGSGFITEDDAIELVIEFC